MEQRISTDVVVVGAGPAGASLAIRLAQEGCETTLIDRSEFPRNKPCAGCFSPRCSPYLERIGLREVVASGQHIRRIAIQTPHVSHTVDVASNPNSQFLFVFPREQFDLLLIENAKRSGVKVITGKAVRSLVTDGTMVKGVRVGGDEIRAQLTVIATGSNKMFLPEEHRQDLRTYHTLIGWYEGYEGDPHTTDSYTAPWLGGTGWIFPESDRKANVGIMVHEEVLKATGQPLMRLFTAFLETSYVRRRLRRAQRTGEIRGSPIRYSTRPKGICGDGFLMVGEASLLTHAMTGEGISHALRSSAIAAEVIMAALEAKDVSAHFLSAYTARIEETFQRNFFKARVLRRALDSPALFEALLACVHFHPWVVRYLEKSIHRIIF